MYMKKTVKTIARFILAAGVLVGLCLAAGEKPDGAPDMIWSLGWIAEALCCSLIANKLKLI